MKNKSEKLGKPKDAREGRLRYGAKLGSSGMEFFPRLCTDWTERLMVFMSKQPTSCSQSPKLTSRLLAKQQIIAHGQW